MLQMPHAATECHAQQQNNISEVCKKIQCVELDWLRAPSGSPSCLHCSMAPVVRVSGSTHCLKWLVPDPGAPQSVRYTGPGGPTRAILGICSVSEPSCCSQSPTYTGLLTSVSGSQNPRGVVSWLAPSCSAADLTVKLRAGNSSPWGSLQQLFSSSLKDATM